MQKPGYTNMQIAEPQHTLNYLDIFCELTDLERLSTNSLSSPLSCSFPSFRRCHFNLNITGSVRIIYMASTIFQATLSILDNKEDPDSDLVIEYYSNLGIEYYSYLGIEY